LHEGKIIYEDKKSKIAIVEVGTNEVIYVKEQENIKLAKDEIRNLNINTQIKIQKEVGNYFHELLEANKGKNYIIETHAALKTKQGYLPGLPKNFLQATEPDVYAIIEADVDEIFVRRLLDKKRKRDHDKSTKDVQTNLDTTRYFASAFAAVTHAPLLIVNNKEKRSEEAANEIANVLKRFME
jgi:adenylate kinase